MSQTYQNPYWVLVNNPTFGTNPPLKMENVTPSSFSNLPFTLPTLPPNGNEYWERLHTSANGVFRECGDPVFYVAGDWIFDDSGAEVGYLENKDLYNKTPYPYPNGLSNALFTENFEQVICEIPNSPSNFFIFYSDSDFELDRLYVSEYDASFNTSASISTPVASFIDGGGIRLALSQANDTTGDRHLYVKGIFGLYEIYIPGSATSHEDLTGLLLDSSLPSYPIGPEMELSHDGNTLAWIESQGAYNAIHIYDISSGTDTYFEPSPQAMKKVSGLEFLPDGRLAVSIEWNNPLFQSLNGIGVFNATFTNFTHVANSGPYYQGMIELGISIPNYWSLYGTSGSAICRIQIDPTNSGSITHTYSQNSLPLESNLWINHVKVSGALPDQVDGSSLDYLFSAECNGNGTENWEEEESDSSHVENETTIYFDPILRIVK